ncbi:MAG: hypothetical protein KDC54_09995 [Lewinella sp.]|nr:hypothetical protein [Lewinella sp.]
MRGFSCWLVVIFFCLGTGLWAQQPADSIMHPVPKPLPQPELQLPPPAPTVRTYEPRQALIWAIIPGGGQVYNRRWWKVPLVYSAFTSMVAIIDYNQSNYNRLQRAYELELAGEPHEFTGTRLESADRLRSLRNGFDRNRQLSFFGLFVVYALQGVEAFVDTHLRNFDMDEDLSRWELKPKILVPYPGATPTPVVSMSLSF